MIKTFLLAYGICLAMVGIGWLAHMYGFSLPVTLAVSTGIVSMSIVIVAVVFSRKADE